MMGTITSTTDKANGYGNEAGQSEAAMVSFRDQYPPPWHVERLPAGYAVRDNRGYVLVRIYALSDAEKSLLGDHKTLTLTHAYTLAKAISRLGEKE